VLDFGTSHDISPEKGQKQGPKPLLSPTNPVVD
jgi:hypothetical protein